MLLKPGVIFEPDIKLRKALKEAHRIFEKHNHLFIITSLKDREHTPGSLHYYGQAFDCRIHHISDDQTLRDILTELNTSLASQYQVLMEDTHIHIEVRQ